MKPRVYLREHRKAKNLRGIDMAERLGIAEKSYYRLEREFLTLNAREMIELADAIGLDDPTALWRPPGAPPSIDVLMEGADEDVRSAVAEFARRIAKRH
jgi:transcriptional regulator with XRE-family HTH domain